MTNLQMRILKWRTTSTGLAKRRMQLITSSRRKLELTPTNAVMWYYRGVLEAQRANFPAAIESQTRSLAIRESAVALKAREESERRIGKVQEADTDLRRFNELDPPRQ